MPLDVKNAFELCRQALGVSQEDLGRMIGVSRRTAQRYSSRGFPSYSMINLARAVHPRNPGLAREVVAAIGTTLEAAGIAAPSPPTPSPPAHVSNGIVDAVVCATAEAMDLMPSEVRKGLHAAFSRAKDIGLSVESIEQALREKLAPAQERREPPAPQRGAAGARARSSRD